MKKTALIFSMILIPSMVGVVHPWSWDSAENVLPSLREDLDREIAMYRQKVLNGMSLRERIVTLDRLVENYKPLGLNVMELETERSRLLLEEQQQHLRASMAQDEAALLYDKGINAYRAGNYKESLSIFREAERLLPQDDAIKETRRKLDSIATIMDSEPGDGRDGQLIRLAVSRYLENDPRRALNAIIYAEDKKLDRPEFSRLRRLIESNHPEVEAPRVSAGDSLITHKLQLTLEAIYDGRYLSAISECNDILDLEPENVMALTRLGSAYFAMNEKEKAKQIWTKALQLDPSNSVLKKFLYGASGASRVETKR